MMRIAVTSSIKKDLSTINRQYRKRLLRVAKLYIAPEQAKIGPALAQIGINSMEFCERFNSQTRALDKELLLAVKLYVFSDKSFAFQIKVAQLKDVVVAFGLDEGWSPVHLLGSKALSASSLKINDDLFISFFKSYMVYNHIYEINNKVNLIGAERFIKILTAYLKSWKV